MRPFKPYMIEVQDATGARMFVRAVPTESSHTWWQVIGEGPRSVAHHQQWHRSEIGRIRNMEGN